MKPLLFLLAPLIFFLCAGCGTKIPLYDLQPGKKIEVRNAGSAVNSDREDHAPVIGLEDRSLFFTRTYHVRSGDSIKPRSGLYHIALGPKGEIVPTGKSESIMNSEETAGGLAFSANGERVIVVSCHGPDGAGDCDLYEVPDFGSASPEFVNLRQINTEYWQVAPALSADGNTLYFTTFTNPKKDATGFADGNIDIHVTRLNSDGFWSKPVPVGAPVNSSYREDGAFLMRGDSALFFSSDRPGGYGKFDLYVSFLQADGSWGPVYNLGPQINTSTDDRYISMTADGNIIYFSSNRSGKGALGGYDIYMARFIP